MDDGMDYDVQTKVSFRLDFDGSGEFNMLLLPDVQKRFTQHVKKVFEQDEMIGYISSDLNFQFDGRMVQLEYTFSCHDENATEAESFSSYSVRCIQKELEEFGCKLRAIDCKAAGMDMSWLDQLEDMVFGSSGNAAVPSAAVPAAEAPRKQPQIKGTPEKSTQTKSAPAQNKPGRKRSIRKMLSQQGR